MFTFNFKFKHLNHPRILPERMPNRKITVPHPYIIKSLKLLNQEFNQEFNQEYYNTIISNKELNKKQHQITWKQLFKQTQLGDKLYHVDYY